MLAITTKIGWDGTKPVPNEAQHFPAEFNDRNVELQNAVTSSGQTLASDPLQLSKAGFINGSCAVSMTAGGSANAISLTPVTGASGLRVPTYAELKGAMFIFKAAADNSGSGGVTINIGQTSGTLLGAKKLFLKDGTSQVPAGAVITGEYYAIRYDSTLDGGSGAFILVGQFFVAATGFGTAANSGLCKAKVNFAGRSSNGACTINKSFGVTSVARQTKGVYRVTFTTAFGDGFYTLSGFARGINNTGMGPTISLDKDGIKTTGYIDIKIRENDSSTDPSEVGVIFFD